MTETELTLAGARTQILGEEARRRGRERLSQPGSTCMINIHGPGLGSRIELGERTTIGRGSENDVVVKLADVSRSHCRISRRDGSYVVEDLGSTNGTYLNEQKLPASATRPLHAGDVLNLGGVIYKVLDGANVEAEYHEELYRTAIVDGLTQIYNRRYLTGFLKNEMARAARYARDMSLVLFDVDYFKQINDEYGHPAGDHVLRELALLVGGSVRQESCFARYGGEEFALVLPETSLSEARLVAERIRSRVEEHRFGSGTVRIPVTVSVGIAPLEPGMSSQEAFLRAADARLYDAKHQGRNRVVG
jgi:diguanylate cyclase (GGDEF)-like protein